MAVPSPGTSRPIPFTVMAKPAGPSCNLACGYCFYREKTALFPAGASMRMSPDVLEAFIRQYCESQAGRQIAFAWQGGEPTLMGLDFFRRAVELQARYAPGRRVTNALQTNGVLLDDEWAAFLAEHRFLVGVSVDGPAGLHDRSRRDRAGQPTLERVLGGIESLKRARVEFNTLTAVGRANVGHPVEVYEFLKGIGSTFHQYIPLVERFAARPAGGDTAGGGAAGACSAGAGSALAGPPGFEDAGGAAVTPWSVEPAAYRDFLCAIFDRWVRFDVGTVFVQHFEAVLAAWTGRPSGICVLDERCGTALVLEHDGSLYSCDHYVYPAYRLGNILETPLAAMAGSERQAAFGDAKRDALPRQCQECAVRFACNGGCPKHRFALTRDGEPGLNHLCAAYGGFIDHARPYLDVMARLLAEERPPALVMDVAKADDLRHALAAAGRNDPCPCGSGRKYKQCCGSPRSAR